MGSPNQPRDWRGRWTAGGGSIAGQTSRRRSVAVQTFKTRRGPRTSIEKQRQVTAYTHVQANRRRAGAPVGGRRNARLVTVYTGAKQVGGNTMVVTATGSRRSARRARRTYNRTGRAPVGTYIVGYNPKG